MALLMDREKPDGTVVKYWVARASSISIGVANVVNDEPTIIGSIVLDGYISKNACNNGKAVSESVSISDLTQDECGTILKRAGKNNMREKIYEFVKLRAGWTTATDETEPTLNESLR